MTVYFKANYTSRAGGSFVGESENFTELTWSGGGRGQIIWDIEDGTDGKMAVALIAGSFPDNETITQGAVSASVATGAATTLLYNAYFRLDASVTDVTGDKEIDWTGPAADSNGVIPTHSLYFDGQTGEFAEGEIVTFSGGAVAEVIRITDQVGNEGELELRFTTNIDAGLPVDGETITGTVTGSAVVQGETHQRTYAALEIHRFLQDLNDDPQFAGDDDLSMLDPTASAKDTDQIIRLIGGAYATDALISRMYGGSVAQNAGSQGDTKYSGLDLQVTTPNADTRPVLIQYDPDTGVDVILADYYSTAWNPDSIAGAIRIMVKTRVNGVDIDGRRIKGKLLEYGDSYFEGGTTLGDATTSLALFSAPDGNNTTDINTVKSYLTTITEGYQTIDYNNGNGATPFAARLNYGGQTSAESYEYTKFLQSRVKTTGPAQPNLFGRDGRLVTGVNRNFAHAAEVGAFTENEVIAWGTEIDYTGQTTNFSLGENITFSGGARARIYGIDDNGATGKLYIGDLEGGTPADAETITGETSGGDGTVGTSGVTINSQFGIGLLIAWDATGNNIYYQTLAGLDPANGQEIYGRTSGATCAVSGTVATRTINNQFIGLYTGTNFQTNFGIGVNSTDAILGDQNRNLLDVSQGVPNNQSGVVTGLVIGDRVEVYPWDGSTLDANNEAVPDFDQLNIATALTGAAETQLNVDSIPDNTPTTGWLRITRASGVRSLIEYTSISGNNFIFASAQDFSGDNAPLNGDAMIGYIAETATGTSASYTAIKGAGNTQVVVIVRRGDNQPIVPARATPIFADNGFNVGINRLDDS